MLIHVTTVQPWAHIQGGTGGHVPPPPPTILKMGDTISNVSPPPPTHTFRNRTHVHNCNITTTTIIIVIIMIIVVIIIILIIITTIILIIVNTIMAFNVQENAVFIHKFSHTKKISLPSHSWPECNQSAPKKNFPTFEF